MSGTIAFTLIAFGVVAAGCASITPLQLDLTHYKAMGVSKKWDV
ncbi:MAG: hypothetical protein ACOYZ8_15710 [Chloroflexota bacterium]